MTLLGGFQGSSAARQRESSASTGFVRTLPAGAVLQRRYEILKILGLGGMSTVYLARDHRFANATKLCAIKEMAELATDEATRQESLDLFESEANVIASLNHQSIPKIYDFFSEDNRPYLVLEYIEGEDLETLLDASLDFLPEGDVLGWAIGICDVLTYLHTRNPDPIIFRDLKPSNVMLAEMGRVVLVDFGIAKVLQSGRAANTVGTQGYAPPEQYRGVADSRGDIYALGATMHHLLSKSDPRMEEPFTFHERLLRKLNPEVSEAVEAVIMQALQHDIGKRFATAAAMKQALLAARSRVRNVQPNPPAPVVTTGASRPIAAATPPVASISLGAGPQLLWTFASQDEIRSTPLVCGGTIYIGSYDKSFYALDARTGTLKWSFTTQGGICSSGCVWQDNVVVGSEDGHIYSFEAATGRQLWSFQTNGAVRSSPRAGASLVYVGSDDQCLYAIDGQSGQMVWHSMVWRPIRSSPALANGMVYFGSDDEYVYAVDAETGTFRWKFRTLGLVISSPAVADELVILGSSDRNIYALDASSGFSVWKTATEGQITSSPAVSGDHIFIGSVDKALYCLELATGNVVWSFPSGGAITSSPRLCGDAVYFGSVDGHLYSLEAATGKLRWKFKTGRPIPGSIAFSEDVVYFGSLDGRLYAVPA